MLSQSTVSKEVHIWRYRVTPAYMIAGVSLNRLHWFRPLLKRADMSLTNESNLSATYVPHIQAQEFCKVKQEIITAQYPGIAYDCTGRLVEAFTQQIALAAMSSS